VCHQCANSRTRPSRVLPVRPSLKETAELVYHDDVGDYSTNEPTMDGTPDSILMIALWTR
jgi:hypothetical protein